MPKKLPIAMNIFIILLIHIFSACATKEVVYDYWNASEEGDFTALVEGCGAQINSGYAYCRKYEGDSSNEMIYFIAPPVTCKTSPCVTVKLLNQSGKIVKTLVFASGETKVGVPWRELLLHDEFKKEDRGYWPFFFEIRFVDEKGLETNLKTDGEIRLRVVAETYLSGQGLSSDRFFNWQWVEGEHLIKMSTGGRVFISPRIKTK